MAVTATIVLNREQANGRRHVRFQFDNDTPVQTDTSTIYRVDGATDVQAFGDAQAAQWAARQPRKERQRIVSEFFQGADIDDAIASSRYRHIGQPAARRACLRRLANRMEDPNERDEAELIACNAYVQTLGAPAIAAALTTPRLSWSNAEANALQSKLAALASGRSGLGHGKGEVEEE